MLPTNPELLRSVLLHPAEDMPRLVYADWLDEQAHTPDDEASRRARFIRLQIAAAACKCTMRPAGQALTCHEYNAKVADYRMTLWCESCLKWQACVTEALSVRPDESIRLLAANGVWHRGFIRDIRLLAANGVWHRGFIRDISLHTECFMERARELFADHPIERVTLSDFRPWHPIERMMLRPWHQGYGGYSIFDNKKVPRASPDWGGVPSDLFNLLSGGRLQDSKPFGRHYANPDLALADLSRACVSHGRTLAGLTDA